MISQEKEQYIKGWQKRKRRQKRKLKEKKQKGLEKAREVADCLYKKHNAKRVILFGSLVQGQFREHSDIDIAVDGIDDYKYFDIVSEMMDIAFPFKIDMIPLADVKTILREKIEREGVEL